MAIEDFAQYKIIKRLGKGGMGEVFLAEDTKLSRRIALKFLSAEAILSKEQIHRFEQEALAISSLNHPNILTIYEIGQSDGREYLATEFVDGKTLREYLSQESVDLQKILDVAVQIGAALETAHEQGIIHRDIKPENIMVRRDGLVKILDFGLAKLVQKITESAIVAVDAEAPTRANLSTAPGLIMGTSFYLSPEQARGKIVDARTDIWSFGVVLYEAITKNHPFKGETTSDVIASILKTDPPPLNLYAANAPAELQRIIKKTLRKDRDDRYQSARDLLVDLKNLNRELSFIKNSDASITPVTQPNEPHPQTDPQIEDVSTKPQTFSSYLGSKPNRFFAALTAAALLALIGFFGWYFLRHKTETAASIPLAVTQLTSWKNDLGEKMLNRARFSPDGKFIAYSSTKSGNSDIWIRQTGGGDSMQLTKDTQSASSPVWSPDGGQIAFLADRGGQKGIWKMPVLGGSMTLLQPFNTLNYNLVHWSKDGKTIYYEINGNLFALDITTQQIIPVTNFDESKIRARDFRISPDEQSFAYVDGDEKTKDIWIMKKDGGEPKRLTDESTENKNPVWLPEGNRLVYNSIHNKIKQIELAFTDGRNPVQLNVSDNNGKVLDVTPDGSKILFSAERNDVDLWGVKLETGKEFQITSDLGLELWANAAPDDNSIAFQSTNLPNVNDIQNLPIIKKSLESDGQSKTLTDDGFAARWSPDGKQLAFLRRIDDQTTNLWVVGGEGGNPHQLTQTNVTFGGYSQIVPYNLVETQDYQWSPDGKSLIFCAIKDGIANVRRVDADGTNETMLSANVEPDLFFFNPTFSPDGKRVAWLSLAPEKKMLRIIWLSDESGIRAIYQSDSLVHIVGWSATGNELILRVLAGTVAEPQLTKDIDLISLAPDGATHPIARLPQTHFMNIKLSSDRKQIAFVSRTNGISSLQIISSNGGMTKTVISNSDTRIYFSDLVWSPEGKTIYYGKQASWSVLSMIENFK